jgi:hypothetical protein
MMFSMSQPQAIDVQAEQTNDYSQADDAAEYRSQPGQFQWRS